LFAALTYAHSVEIVNALVKAGAHVNTVSHARTPLMEVARGIGLEEEHVVALLNALVDAGANVNWISPACESAIEIAHTSSRVAGRNAAEIVLIQHGADASLSQRCRTEQRIAREQRMGELAKEDGQAGVAEFTATDLNDNLARFRHPTMLFFYDVGCGWCTKMDAIVANIAKVYRGKIETARVDVKKVRAAADRYNLTALPTLLLVKNGVAGKPLVGAKDEATTKAWLDRELNAKKSPR
jgi:thioredoxin 1